MNTIEKIFEVNKSYDMEKEKLDKLYIQLKSINNSIDLNEVRNDLDYARTKNIYEFLRYRVDDIVLDELRAIMEEKKIKEYPEILKVHYYPTIKEIEFINENQKVILDKLVMEAYSNLNKRRKLNSLNSNILDYLCGKNIVEKQYIFHCTCGSDECSDKIISQERFDKLKEYWEKEIQGLTTHEEDQTMNYGCFESGCWNDGSVEVCDLESFNEHLRRVEYKVIQKPDMTLDDI